MKFLFHHQQKEYTLSQVACKLHEALILSQQWITIAPKMLPTLNIQDTQTANNRNIPVRLENKRNELQKSKTLKIIALIHQPTHTHVGNFSYAFFRNDTKYKTIKSVLDIRTQTNHKMA